MYLLNSPSVQGQTCFDVADEDMLEYLEELEEAQDKDAVIEEPLSKMNRQRYECLFLDVIRFCHKLLTCMVCNLYRSLLSFVVASSKETMLHIILFVLW